MTERDIIDAIDELVDWQLEGGDRSDSFHGEQFRENHPCVWCGQEWHFLPITEEMERMRRGSYARDEFGYGIVDPSYSYRDDESGILCPGSEFYGPPDKWGTWDKQRREKAQSPRQGRTYNPPTPRPSLPPGRLRRLRFHGPFKLWTVALDDEREIEEIRSNPALVGLPGPERRIPVVTQHRLTVTWELNFAIRGVRDHEWINRNHHDIEEMVWNASRQAWDCQMKDVKFPFDQFTVHADSPRAEEPDWVEFQTTYPVEERHPWFAQFWVWSGTSTDCHLRPVVQEIPQAPRGFESDYVIIDEAYSFNFERLRQYVEDARREAQETAGQAER